MTQAEIEKMIQKQHVMEALKQKRKREREEKKLQKKRAVRK